MWDLRFTVNYILSIWEKEMPVLFPESWFYGKKVLIVK